MEAKLDIPDLDLEKFRIYDRTEIQRILRELARDHQLISAYFDNGREFLLTSVLAVEEGTGRVILDYGPDEQINRRLLAQRQAVAVASHRQVRVQFRLEHLIAIDYEDAPAFIALLPDSLVRIQRREFYRITTPTATRLRCIFTSEEGEQVEAPVLDISIGGVGLLEPKASDFPWEPGSVIREVRVELPTGEEIVADMQIRNRFATQHHEEGSTYRVGCMFLHLDNRQCAAIQRFIHRTELERRRMMQG